MGLAATLGHNVELQCWVLHTRSPPISILCWHSRTAAFSSSPRRMEVLEYAALDVIRTDREGFVQAPSGSGLGIGIDWNQIEAASLGCITADRRTS